MDQETFYHRGATWEIMEIKRKRNKSPEIRTLVEQKNALSRSGTLRRRYELSPKGRYPHLHAQINTAERK